MPEPCAPLASGQSPRGQIPDHLRQSILRLDSRRLSVVFKGTGHTPHLETEDLAVTSNGYGLCPAPPQSWPHSNPQNSWTPRSQVRLKLRQLRPHGPEPSTPHRPLCSCRFSPEPFPPPLASQPAWIRAAPRNTRHGT